MQKSMSIPALLVINAYWAGMSFMWNALHPIVLPALLAGLVPSYRKNTYLGLLTFVGLVIAMLLQPISGTLSDRWVSRFGRRRPLMVIGTALDVVFLLILGWAGGLAWIFLGYVGLQISSNTAQGPLQGLLRDRVPPHQLGVASSIKVFLDLASLVAASAIAGRLLKAGPGGLSSTILVVLGLLLVGGAVTIVLSHEEPSRAPKKVSTSRVGPGESDVSWLDGSYWWLISERAAFLLGVYGLQAFGQYYLQDVLRVPNPPQQTGTLLSVVGVGTITCVVAGGWLSDRLGSRRLLYAASALTSAGMLLMLAVADLRSLYAVGSLVGAGIGLFLTSNWALANKIAPAAQAGQFLGLTNVATAGAAALARLQGPAVDLLNAWRPGVWLGYRGIFIFGALCIAVSALFLTRVRRTGEPIHSETTFHT